MNNQKNKLIEQTESQRNPYAARPEDFPISEPDEIASRRTPYLHEAEANSVGGSAEENQSGAEGTLGKAEREWARSNSET